MFFTPFSQAMRSMMQPSSTSAGPRSGRWARVLRVALATVIGATALPAVAHAITVTPSALYIDARTRTGSVTLFNEGTEAVEVTIAFAFGYPRTDLVSGEVRVELTDTVPAHEPSAVAWLRAFPRRVVIQPGQRQLVRVTATPPANLADGEYWGRLVITTQATQLPVERGANGVNVAISLRTQFVQAVNVRKGAVTTGLTVGRTIAASDSDRVRLVMDLKREGNAAFIGRLAAELVSPAGAVIGSGEVPIAVYRDFRAQVHISRPAGGVPAGSSIRWLIDTERPDLPPEGPLPFPARRGSVRVP